jgi:hypothetical protein
METLKKYTYIGNVKSRLIVKGKPFTKWTTNSDCKTIALMVKKTGLAKEDEISIEVWK